jgi:hypothetical protein
MELRDTWERCGVPTPFGSVSTYEELSAFEYSTTNRSHAAWKALLSDLGVAVDDEIVTRLLTEKESTYHAPAPTADSVYNAGEVEAMLQSRFPSLLWMFRR